MKRVMLLVSSWLLAAMIATTPAGSQIPEIRGGADSSVKAPASGVTPAEPAAPLNSWGLDILVSNGGFGLGTFYRRELTPDLVGFVDFSISESKDEREIERFDPYYQISFVPGKLNRFLVLPLMVGAQYRLFRDDIVDSFRPYVNAAAGPSMVYMMPFVEFVPRPEGGVETRQVDFFRSIGRGSPHYTASVYVGLGANFGAEKATVFGVNFRYYFTYLFDEGLPSIYNTSTGQLTTRKKDFGGFFITVNFGMAY